MKRTFLFCIFVLVSLGVFADESEYIPTSEGEYELIVTCLDKNRGQAFFDSTIELNKMFGLPLETDVKLSKGQWECVNKVLGRYRTARGDTFVLTFTESRIKFVCEFTSNTQYNYWATRSALY